MDAKVEMNFKGKVVLVTGACSGIGASVSREFIERGATLIMTGLSELPPNDLKGCWISADLSKDYEVKRVFNFAIKMHGRLDVLVNCAGILKNNSVENSSPEELSQVLDINLKSYYHLTSLATKALSESKGCIVNVSSITGMRSFPGIAAYCISKAGVDQLTRVSALELASKYVRVNSVNPGVVETPIYINAGMNSDQVCTFFESSKRTHPIGRVAKPREIAAVIAFLASDHAAFITGVNLPVDGGRHLTCSR